jgi:hypothetical protein
MLRRSVLGFSMLVLPACPADDGAADDTQTSTSGDTDGTGSGTTMTPSTMSVSSASTSSTTDDMTDGSATTNDSTDTGGSTASTGSDSISTGVEEATYPPCDPRMEPPCPKGYDACYDAIPGYNVCNVINCETPDDCPPANGGEAEVLCIPFEGGTCVLDCPGGLACPEGMECVLLGQSGVERCLWPV